MENIENQDYGTVDITEIKGKNFTLRANQVISLPIMKDSEGYFVRFEPANLVIRQADLYFSPQDLQLVLTSKMAETILFSWLSLVKDDAVLTDLGIIRAANLKTLFTEVPNASTFNNTYPCNSSTISSFAYDPDTSTLKIKFHNGSSYLYYEVHPDQFARLANSESIGKFFIKNIKPRYKFVKLAQGEIK